MGEEAGALKDLGLEAGRGLGGTEASARLQEEGGRLGRGTDGRRSRWESLGGLFLEGWCCVSVTVADYANSDPAVVRSGRVKKAVANAVQQEGRLSGSLFRPRL